ncbi:hypothetical protein [Lysobacter sp. Root983]|uniref:hypothetical protein n=1 Tax=Lysobacter sp. Root983 TaxID=1736613 RepID=UPI0007103E01|nr:hypothetical protein [Lysobacter sp. Root983]KRD77305.1 hypothetical protein ASE43_09125 [Lysobacter sp. Root983]
MWTEVAGYLIDPRQIAALGPVHPSGTGGGGGAVASTFEIVTLGGHVVLPKFADANQANAARNALKGRLPA